MTPNEARARFVGARVAHLATADSAGVPHLVPVTFAVEGDSIFTAADAKRKRPGPLRRMTNVEVNSAVSLLVDQYDENWQRLWWARADGFASVADHGAALDHALALLRARYAQYGEVQITGPALIVRVDRWTGWTASD